MSAWWCDPAWNRCWWLRSIRWACPWHPRWIGISESRRWWTTFWTEPSTAPPTQRSSPAPDSVYELCTPPSRQPEIYPLLGCTTNDVICTERGVNSHRALKQLSHHRAARWPRSERGHSQTSCADFFPGRAATLQLAWGLCWYLGWLSHCESRTLPGGGIPSEYIASEALQSFPTPEKERRKYYKLLPGENNKLMKTEGRSN